MMSTERSCRPKGRQLVLLFTSLSIVMFLILYLASAPVNIQLIRIQSSNPDSNHNNESVDSKSQRDSASKAGLQNIAYMESFLNLNMSDIADTSKQESNASGSNESNIQNYPSINYTSSERLIYNSKQQKWSRLVYSATRAGFDINVYANFSACEYKDCILKFGEKVEEMKDADVLLFEFNKIPTSLADNSPERANQLWLIYALESPAYGRNKWNPALVNNRFNLTATYRRDSDVPIPYYKAVKVKEENSTRMIDYSAGKTKGAFAYVSNCQSSGYDRLDLMEKLKKYIDVDIYGRCTNSYPCRDSTCENNLHKQYRFYLSFENSLCKDYITEKFWKHLSSSDILLPVAMGGLSLDEYVEVAPPDSFLHVYNFSSIDTLGAYLKQLMVDNCAYNRYHPWRQQYKTEKFNFCKVCELAHTNYQQRAYNDLASWWNTDTCKTF